ncbi:MAG: ATP-binding protein [Deltaproteobacteria bacterium]|nr:ATP-binding protein [Deltaproteobacteria bacterium]
MLGRHDELSELKRLLKRFPVVAIVGPRQVGKTTLALRLLRDMPGTHLDMENPADARRMEDPATTLGPLRGLVVIDEVQRLPGVFSLLRVLADRPRSPARFLVLGSASPELLRQSSETLAGRMAYLDLSGFLLRDTGARAWRRLWLRGGFPRSFLARSDADSFEWRQHFQRTFLERDLPQLGVTTGAATLGRFWAMLAHVHGQVWNASRFGSAFGVADTTARRYLDLLEATFMVQVLRPWSDNRGKRLVKSPKVYFRDSGVLHQLLDVRTGASLLVHPAVGASFEGFALAQVMATLGATPRECHFWATHHAAELDLVVERAGSLLGFEFKHTVAPRVTPSMRIAMEDLGLKRLDVIHLGKDTYPLAKGIRAVSVGRVLDDVGRL